jgi:hypothetical protein
MYYNCPNPDCDASHNVLDSHIGRRFTCKKCGSLLVVEEDGLRLEDAAVVEPDEPRESSGGGTYRARSVRRQNSPADGLSPFNRSLGAVIGPTCTTLLGIGTVFIIVFLFFPLIDQAKIARRTALIEEGDLRLKRQSGDFNQKGVGQPPFDKMKGGAMDDAAIKQERRRLETEKWERDKVPLQQDVDEAKVSFRRSLYWYHWGTLFGFLILAVAALGYLHPSQSTIRRTIGAVVITGEVVLAFVAFAITSIVTSR